MPRMIGVVGGADPDERNPALGVEDTSQTIPLTTILSDAISSPNLHRGTGANDFDIKYAFIASDTLNIRPGDGRIEHIVQQLQGCELIIVTDARLLRHLERERAFDKIVMTHGRRWRPTNKVTGLRTPDITYAQMKMLRELYPDVPRPRVALVHVQDSHWGGDPDPIDTLSRLDQFRAAGTAAGVQVINSGPEAFTVTSPSDFEPVLGRAARSSADVIHLVTHEMFGLYPDSLAEIANGLSKPVSHPRVAHVEAGGFICLGLDPADLREPLCAYVRGLLTGATPAQLRPRFRRPMLAINLSGASPVERYRIPEEVLNNMVNQATYVVTGAPAQDA